MNPLSKIRVWGTAYPKLLGLLRITLGLILIFKGISFILNLGLLHLFLKDTGIDNTLGLSASINLLAQLIIIFNILGGICIALNLHTRLFCLFNLPVLFGAVFLVNMQRGAFRPHAEFWLSLFCLLAIIFVLTVQSAKGIVVHQQAETV